VIRWLLVLGLLFADAAAVYAFDVLPDPYRAAAAAGALGNVSGRV